MSSSIFPDNVDKVKQPRCKCSVLITLTDDWGQTFLITLADDSVQTFLIALTDDWGYTFMITLTDEFHKLIFSKWYL